MFIESCCLADIETSTIPTEPIAEEQAVTDYITQVHAEILTRHIDYHVNIHIQMGLVLGVYAELIVRPTPDILSNII
jgi:hypothetical protein